MNKKEEDWRNKPSFALLVTKGVGYLLMAIVFGSMVAAVGMAFNYTTNKRLDKLQETISVRCT